jgi:hypothetical protein
MAFCIFIDTHNTSPPSNRNARVASLFNFGTSFQFIACKFFLHFMGSSLNELKIRKKSATFDMDPVEAALDAWQVAW